MSKLKICAISDLHGYLPEINEHADIMIIAGDVSPLYLQFNKKAMDIWLKTKFANWIKKLPVEKVYLIAGNHDAYFEGIDKIKLESFVQNFESKLIYLENDCINHIHNGKEYKIYWYSIL